MDRHSIRKFQLIQQFVRIFHHTPFIKIYRDGLCKIIDLLNNSGISVKHPGSFVYAEPVFAADFPFQLIIIFDLHDFIAFPENDRPMLFLLFSVRWRVQIHLQNRIETFYSEQPFPHRRKHLDIVFACPHKFRKFLLDQLQRNVDNFICLITLQEKEIHALVIQADFFSPVNLMRIDNNITGACLSENFCQHYRRKHLRINNVLQHTSRPYTRQLIHISHQDQTRAR